MDQRYYRLLPSSIRDEVGRNGIVPNPFTGNSMHFWDNLEDAQRYHGIVNGLEPHDMWEVVGPGNLVPDPWFSETNHDWENPGAWRSDATHIPAERVRRVSALPFQKDRWERTDLTDLTAQPPKPTIHSGAHVYASVTPLDELRLFVSSHSDGFGSASDETVCLTPRADTHPEVGHASSWEAAPSGGSSVPGVCQWCGAQKENAYGLCPRCHRFPPVSVAYGQWAHSDMSASHSSSHIAAQGLTDNRPSCKEFLPLMGIRESSQRAAEPNSNFSNIRHGEWVNPFRSPEDSPEAGPSQIPFTYNHNTCPKCGAQWSDPSYPGDDEQGSECPKCGYDIPWDGWEALEGWHNPYQWAKEQDWTHEPTHFWEEDWGPRRFGGWDSKFAMNVPVNYLHRIDPTNTLGDTYPERYGEVQGYANRWPLLWDGQTLHIGPEGSTHYQMKDAMGDMQDKYRSEGWIGHNPEREPEDEYGEFGNGTRVGWYAPVGWRAWNWMKAPPEEVSQRAAWYHETFGQGQQIPSDAPQGYGHGYRVMERQGAVGQIMNPAKFFTTDSQHERRKKNYLERWGWHQGAADPKFLNEEWYPTNGPYMYHGTTQSAADKIAEEGLFPHDHLGTGETRWVCPNCHYSQNEEPRPAEKDNMGEVICPSCGDQYLKERPDYSNSEYAGGYWEPRMGHVYLGTQNYIDPYAMKSNGALLRIDLRKLDPAKMSADEDHWTPALGTTDIHHPIVRAVHEENPPPSGYDFHPDENGLSLGAWADDAQLGDLHPETHYSMEKGSMAYNGHIPAEAIERVSPYNFEPYHYDEQGKPFVKVMSRERNPLEPSDPNVDYYYHYAPTEDRARIMQHGLQPSDPAYSENWGGDSKRWKQPTGVYVTKDPDDFGRFQFDRNVDLWRIPAHQVSEVMRDRLLRNKAWIIPHAVRAELHDPYENSQKAENDLSYHLLNQGELPPGGDWQFANGWWGERAPDFKEIGIGRGTRRGLDPFSGALVPENPWGEIAKSPVMNELLDYQHPQLPEAHPGDWDMICPRCDGRMDPETMQTDPTRTIYECSNCGYAAQHRTAKETQNQLMKRWESLNKVLPNTAEVLHNFPNGWTVQKLNTGADVRRTGLTMLNCWKDRSPTANVSGQHRTLNDPSGIPRLAFFEAKHPMGMTVLNQPLQIRNKSLTPEHYQMLSEYGQLSGAHVHPFDHYHAMGMDHYNPGPIQGMIGEGVPAGGLGRPSDAGVGELPETSIYGEQYEASAV